MALPFLARPKMTDSTDESIGSTDSAGWSMQVGEEAGADGEVVYHATVYRAGAYVCRIALADNYPDRVAAEEALKLRVQQWIAEYAERPHSGQTWFGPMTR
jgi:hypothetical protein